MSEERARMVLTVRPDPTLEELAAITAAVTAALQSLTQTAAFQLPETSRWSRQGRLEAMGGADPVDSHW